MHLTNNPAGGDDSVVAADMGAAGAPEITIPDEIAHAGWERLIDAFDLQEDYESDPLEVIKRAYLVMSRLMATQP